MIRWSAYFSLVVVVTLHCHCAGEQASPDKSSPRRFLSIGTAPPGGAFFVVGGAMAQVLNENRGEMNWDVTAEATKGSQENIRRIQRGELDLGLSNAGITHFAVQGGEGWDRAYDMRAVMTLAPNVAMFITPSDSGVREITDLKGRRVVVGVAGAGYEFFVKPLLAAHHITYEDFTPLNNTQTGAADMLADGSASAAFLGGAVPTASITQATTTQDIHFVPFSDEAKRELAERYPFFRPVSIPAGTYKGLDEEYRGLDVGSLHLITSSQMSEALVYQLTRTIFENRDGVAAIHAAGRAINHENVVRNTGIDFHPGAIRYYKEIGIWPETH